MIFPPFQSSNQHTVLLYGRLFFQISSASRKGLHHFVDLERTNYPDGEGKDRYFNSLCTCEAFRYGERPCRHIKAAFEAIAEWANVEESIREEWTGRLMFLLNMGHSFADAIQSESMQALRPKPKPNRAAREYVIRVNDGRRYENHRREDKAVRRRPRKHHASHGYA